MALYGRWRSLSLSAKGAATVGQRGFQGAGAAEEDTSGLAKFQAEPLPQLSQEVYPSLRLQSRRWLSLSVLSLQRASKAPGAPPLGSSSDELEIFKSQQAFLSCSLLRSPGLLSQIQAQSHSLCTRTASLPSLFFV